MLISVHNDRVRNYNSRSINCVSMFVCDIISTFAAVRIKNLR